MKLKVKVKLHNKTYDFRKHKHGNMWDLAANGLYQIPGPKSIKAADVDSYIELSNAKVKLGTSMNLPKYYGVKLQARSSLYKYFGCILANGVGEVEADYSEEYFAILVKLTNNCRLPSAINPGDRVLQMQIYLLPNAPWWAKLRDIFVSGFKFEEVDVLTKIRGGEGSTGIN